MSAKLCNACHTRPRLPSKNGRMTWCRTCKAEWQRQYRAGVRKQVRIPPPVRVGECLIWQGKPMSNGYYVLWGNRYVHRVVFEENYGVIPGGLTVDHLCENKACVEPTHLDLCTRGENTRRYYERRAAA